MMFKCKRCHAPDELNGIGLCKHCTDFIKKDVKRDKKRLEEIYGYFPEGMESLDAAQKTALLNETKDLFSKLDSYNRMSFPVGSYLMPVRKILHFLDGTGSVERELFAGRRRRTRLTAAFCAALAVAFAVILAVLGTNPLTSGEPGEAVNVSAPTGGENEPMMDGMGMPQGGPGMEPNGPDLEGSGMDGAPFIEDGAATTDGTIPFEGSDMPEGALSSDGTGAAGDEAESGEPAQETSAGEGESPEESSGDTSADASATNEAAGAAMPAPVRVSGGGSGFAIARSVG